MTVALKDVIGRLPAKQRKAIAARAAHLIAEEMSLRDLRRALQLTQQRMAHDLGIGQEGVSRLEKRSDLLISTLRSYVEALGGRLRFVAEFPDRPPVLLSGLATFASEKVKKAARGASSRERRVHI
jgi:transcriptional regulator with XRE-family HTH domain